MKEILELLQQFRVKKFKNSEFEVEFSELAFVDSVSMAEHPQEPQAPQPNKEDEDLYYSVR